MQGTLGKNRTCLKAIIFTFTSSFSNSNFIYKRPVKNLENLKKYVSHNKVLSNRKIPETSRKSN